MRVLFLHQFDLDLAGGSGTYLRLLRAGLNAAGHHTNVLAARTGDRQGLATYGLPFDFTMTFGPERRAGERTFDDFSVDELQTLSERAAESVVRQLGDDARPDLLIANHIAMQTEVARLLSTRLDLPYRVISYGTDGQLLERDQRYVGWLKPAVVRADKVFAISKFVALQLGKVFESIDTPVLGGAVDKGVFHPAPIAPDPDRLAFVGRLVSEKGIDTFIEAATTLGRPIALEVVGEGPLLDRLRATSPANVTFHGFLPPAAVRDVLVRSSALVVPSLWEEPLGLVVLEAMACGVPVIGTSVGGIPEMIRSGRNGILIEPDDVPALAGAIDRIVADRRYHARLVDGCLHSTQIATPVELASGVLG